MAQEDKWGCCPSWRTHRTEENLSYPLQIQNQGNHVCLGILLLGRCACSSHLYRVTMLCRFCVLHVNFTQHKVTVSLAERIMQ